VCRCCVLMVSTGVLPACRCPRVARTATIAHSTCARWGGSTPDASFRLSAWRVEPPPRTHLYTVVNGLFFVFALLPGRIGIIPVPVHSHSRCFAICKCIIWRAHRSGTDGAWPLPLGTTRAASTCCPTESGGHRCRALPFLIQLESQASCGLTAHRLRFVPVDVLRAAVACSVVCALCQCDAADNRSHRSICVYCAFRALRLVDVKCQAMCGVSVCASHPMYGPPSGISIGGHYELAPPDTEPFPLRLFA
jgi:hypothetical protein